MILRIKKKYAAVTYLFGLVACAYRPREYMREPSPNGSDVALITQYYPDLKGYPHYRLELVSGGKRYELAAPETHDWSMRFAVIA